MSPRSPQDSAPPDNFFEALEDLREYDVPYYVRTSIDREVRVGLWYKVTASGSAGVGLEALPDMVEKAGPRILAFDIECTKAPLKFPDAAMDQIYMISYMLDGRGFLIINRAIVSQDVPDFEYTPKPAFTGPFTVWNEADEEACLKAFFSHIQSTKPQVFVTYNGDFFDWPFVETRAAAYGMDMYEEIGVRATRSGEYRGRAAVHMDCLYWVKRDSYLPSGSHGLKAVTKYKLGYDPVEIDPEDMLRLAAEQPLHMASYSVSDAVATYYLYMKYVHNFVFSLCTIIPMQPDDVLRKGSGTLCEMLLMVEAHRGNIVCPNKQVSGPAAFHEGHLLETETYVGGHVECLESGVFRSDLPTDFSLDPSAFDELISKIDQALTFAIEVENGVERSQVVNYDEVRAEIVERLELLRDTPCRSETPSVYHLDVAAMYPNIILSNRLQPCAIVDETICASCDFNSPEHKCKRDMEWVWRGEYYPLSRSELRRIEAQLEVEVVDGVPYPELPREEREGALKRRVKEYSQRVYKRVKDTTETSKVATICQRENPFYVETVRAFRDRRYEYKGLTKTWVKKLVAAEKGGDALEIEAAKARVVYYDSLQLAHKCILNSFYGYVMRRGARWHSMEMAGVVTYTGATLITQARELVERIGRPLELDTDGIWCILPSSFPEDYSFKTIDGKKLGISYPCVMLNADVHDRYTNHQYQMLQEGGSRAYSIRSECSIFFEVDGPYKCMVLPASQEEGKLLKKRYAVFNFDGSLAELKGFELKRRGELKIIKIFQEQVFARFLMGDSLESCYAAVADTANYWLDILLTKGADVEDEELLELISENRNLSKRLEEYGAAKGTAISTAKRLAEFLGAEMVKDAGLTTKLVIARRPEGAPVTERAIPTAIFSADEPVMKHFLRKWCKDSGMTDFDLRNIVDWDYYTTRLSTAIQKIVTIPAGLQGLDNPVPRVEHPDWLLRIVKERLDPMQQTKLSSFFTAPPPGGLPRGGAGAPALDIEDACPAGTSPFSRALAKRPRVHMHRRPHAARTLALGQGPAAPGAIAGKASPNPAGGTASPAEDAAELQTVSYHARADDFIEWLGNRKQHWRRAKRRLLAESAPGTLRGPTVVRSVIAPSKQPVSTGGLFQSDSSSALVGGFSGTHWQVLQVRQDPAKPGRLMVWAMTGPDRMQQLAVTADRTVYINYRRHRSDLLHTPGLNLVERTLPHSHRARFLYAYTCGEEQFLRRGGFVQSALASPHVEGVYESQVSALSRALLQLSCVVGVSKKRQQAFLRAVGAGPTSTKGAHRDRTKGRARKRAAPPGTALEGTKGIVSALAEQGEAAKASKGSRAALAAARDAHAFQLHELETLPLSTFPYLSVTSANLVTPFLYHAQARRQGRVNTADQYYGVVAVLEPSDSNRDVALRALAGEVVLRQAAAGVQVSEADVMRDLAANPGIWDQMPEAVNSLVLGRDVALRGTLHLVFYGGAAGSEGARLRPTASSTISSTAADPECPWLHPATRLESRVSFHPSLADVWPVVSGILSKHVARGARPAMLLTQTPQSCTALAALVPSAAALPHVELAPHKADVDLLTGDALGWRWAGPMVARVLQRFGEAQWELVQRRAAATFHHLPVGNVPGGTVRSHALDIAYGRALTNNAHLLWASDALQPDLGGSEAALAAAVTAAGGGDFAAANQSHSAGRMAGKTQRGAGELGSDSDPLSIQRAPGASPVISRPGTYRRICVEFRLNLVITSIINYDALDDMSGSMAALPAAEGQDAAGDEQAAGIAAAGAGEGGDVSAALRVLRALLRRWANTVLRGGAGADEAHAMLDNVYKWLSSPSSLLYDPLLLQAVHSLMRRCFHTLISEIRGLGGTVVHATFHQLTLSTNKSTPLAAIAHVRYIMNTLLQKPLFRHLQSTTERVWTNLVFLDSANYGGVALEQAYLQALQGHEARQAARNAADQKEQSDDEDEDVQGPARQGADTTVDVSLSSLRTHKWVTWNIATFLPAEAQRAFAATTGFLIEKVDQFKRLRASQRRTARMTAFMASQTQVGAPAGTVASTEDLRMASVSDADALERVLEAPLTMEEESNEAEAETVFMHKLFEEKILPAAQRYTNALMLDARGDMQFPDPPGGHLKMTNPALEFAKAVCRVLALDAELAGQVAIMRKNLLRMLHVEDFTPEAAWHEPCHTVVLPVICANPACLRARDLDLCRDPIFKEIPARMPGASESAFVRAWACDACGEVYDRGEVEKTLVSLVHQRSAAYQTQDLYCTKSKEVKADKLGVYSSYSGKYACGESPQQMQKSLQVFASLARHHNFSWLADTVAFVTGQGTQGKRVLGR